MADPRHTLGRQAEDAAAAWLQAQGWTVLARRYRHPSGGEVDLIALDVRGALVGVEVRARRSWRAGGPEESVDGRRVRRIARTLAAFAAASGARHTGLRIDLVAAQPIGSVETPQLRLRRLPNLEG